MREIYRFHRWPEVDAAAEPTDAGRRLDIGGFVLNDPFEYFLQHISEDYLQAAWQRLHPLLIRYQLAPTDLSWGAPHPGETYIPNRPPNAPSDFIGWTSRELALFYKDRRYEALDTELQTSTPVLRCVATWRSLKWAIAPDNFRLALQLVEALCTDEMSSWNPDYVLRNENQPTEPWLQIAWAIRERNRRHLEQAVDAARAAYSEIGYRIVIRGYTAFIQGSEEDDALHLPSL
jgi:hypothetical protein